MVASCGLMAMSNIVTHYEALGEIQTGYKLGGMVVGIMLATFGAVTCYFIKEKPERYELIMRVLPLLMNCASGFRTNNVGASFVATQF